MKKQWLVLAAAIIALFASCAKPQTTWITNLDEAKTASAKQKKDLLIVFTGSDWNDPSKALIQDVFTKDFFKKETKKFVLANVDIVQDETKMDKTALEANYKAATAYGVQSLPSFVLVTPDGDVYATTTTTDDTKTLDAVVKYLDTFKDARKKLVDLKKKIGSTKGADKAKAIDLFVEAVQPSQREHYGDLIRQVPDLDADGKAGLKGKYQLQVAYLDAVTLYQAKKLTEAGDCFLKLAEGTTLNAAQTQEAWYMGAYMYAMSGSVENDKVLEWLEKAIAADPQNPGAEQITQTIEQIKKNPVKKTN
jgi:thioredoxin-related protein